MSRSNKALRNTVRKPYRDMSKLSKDYKMDNMGVFLYGKLMRKSRARGWCRLHNCYLDSKDIKEKRCKIKRCKDLEIRGQNDGVF